MPIKNTEFFTMSRTVEGNERKVSVRVKIPLRSVGISFVVWGRIDFLLASEFYLSN